MFFRLDKLNAQTSNIASWYINQGNHLFLKINVVAFFLGGGRTKIYSDTNVISMTTSYNELYQSCASSSEPECLIENISIYKRKCI